MGLNFAYLNDVNLNDNNFDENDLDSLIRVSRTNESS